jgi:hypothetical protein
VQCKFKKISGQSILGCEWLNYLSISICSLLMMEQNIYKKMGKLVSGCTDAGQTVQLTCHGEWPVDQPPVLALCRRASPLQKKSDSRFLKS